MVYIVYTVLGISNLNSSQSLTYSDEPVLIMPKAKEGTPPHSSILFFAGNSYWYSMSLKSKEIKKKEKKLEGSCLHTLHLWLYTAPNNLGSHPHYLPCS